jgi:Transposase IS116/IS110/IS902 family.
VQYYAQRLINLNEQRKTLISRMVKLAKFLPNHDLKNLESIPGFAQATAVRVLAELGNIRRFSNPNTINAFIGIDPGRYQPDEMDAILNMGMQ